MVCNTRSCIVSACSRIYSNLPRSAPSKSARLNGSVMILVEWLFSPSRRCPISCAMTKSTGLKPSMRRKRAVVEMLVLWTEFQNRAIAKIRCKTPLPGFCHGSWDSFQPWHALRTVVALTPSCRAI